MAKMWSIKIRRPVRIIAPIHTRAQRLELGNVALRVVRDRIKSAQNAEDRPARPLSTIRPRHGGASYAIVKTKRTGRNKRDWTYTGAMLASLRVTVATLKRIVISPTDDQKVKMARNQALDEMFALSPKDEHEVNLIFELRAAQNANKMVSIKPASELT